ncbi:MAG: pyruvate formate-lyase-activating protein [Oculatellaceae cyanobacterium bins.114]|nr:pyruvate formate-lyase-activating protein [Oculatellaceae cyanobacterium bins.114]
MTTTGRIHSVETCGTVDGPGIRFVVFTEGCPLRCLYCHNPDCRHGTDGKTVAVEALIHEIQAYSSYIRLPGGVTVSGGEPLMQPEFVRQLLKRCKECGFHTVLDTSGYTDLDTAKPVLDYVDLVLLDIKSFDPEIYTQVTHVSIEPTLNFARYLSDIQKPTWIRFVLVPGLTDPVHNIEGLADFVATLKNVEKVEVLPFHKMGEYKWEQLGYDYQLKNTQPPTPELINQTMHIFESRGLKVA